MPVELNLYTYCHNNPIILVDPHGFVLAGTALIIWDMCDEDSFVREAVGNLVERMNERNEFIEDEIKGCP